MLRFSAAAALVIGCTTAACSPSLDWRTVRVEPIGLRTMLPCKPDKETRKVPLADQLVSLNALACDAAGASFAVLWADLGGPGSSHEVLAQWKKASLAKIRSTAAQETAFRPPGAHGLPTSQLVLAVGQGADGAKLESQAAYFARGGHVVQAVVFAEKIKPDMAEPFFSGLSFE